LDDLGVVDRFARRTRSSVGSVTKPDETSDVEPELATLLQVAVHGAGPVDQHVPDETTGGNLDVVRVAVAINSWMARLGINAKEPPANFRMST
jgi:hypothetical protein